MQGLEPLPLGIAQRVIGDDKATKGPPTPVHKWSAQSGSQTIHLRKPPQLQCEADSTMGGLAHPRCPPRVEQPESASKLSGGVSHGRSSFHRCCQHRQEGDNASLSHLEGQSVRERGGPSAKFTPPPRCIALVWMYVMVCEYVVKSVWGRWTAKWGRFSPFIYFRLSRRAGLGCQSCFTLFSLFSYQLERQVHCV